jgi:type II secretory pathway component PulM
MKKYFEQLRPMERRLAVGVLVVILLVFNYVEIWPHFSDWGNADAKISQDQQTLKSYQEAIDQTANYQRLLKEFESQGASVAPEEQSVDLMRTVTKQAGNTQVNIVSQSRSTTRTNNVFFIEQVQTINVSATDEQLVNFLYNLGNDPAMIRVRDLELTPDGPRQHLNGAIELVASYQRSFRKDLKNATASAQ